MPIRERDVKRVSAILLVAALVILSFFIVLPVMLSVISALVLAYVCYPVYKYSFKLLKEKNIAALATCLLIVLLLFLPLWFIIPVVIRQLFDVFTVLQSLDVGSFVRAVLVGSSVKIQADITTTLIALIGKITTYTLTGLTSFLLDLPNVLLHLAVMIFVFFFTLRDGDKLLAFVHDVAPIKKDKQPFIARQFKQITNSVVYGTLLIGIVQGILTGIGLLIFGVPNAIVLMFLAVFASIIPVMGPWLIWIPATIYLLINGHVVAGIIFAAYCILIVSTIDNILRPFIIARSTRSSSAIVLIGMLGGLITFGIIGLVIGPLVLEYLIIFLEAYRNKSLMDLFEGE